ncbi:MAG: biotin/lipoyl-containing protein, partial [Luteitalea sp.]
MANQFTLPSLGDNVKAGDVLRMLVKPGDTVTRDQAVMELETDKATVEVPSSIEGTVAEVKVKDGDRIEIGQVVFTVAGDGAAPAAETPVEAPVSVATASAEAVDAQDTAQDKAPDGAPQAAGEPPASSGRIEVTLPSLGDNVEGGDVLHVLVKVGDTVAKDQGILELETDKATVEVPSPAAGTVKEVAVNDGDQLAVGQLVLVLEGAVAHAAAAASIPAAAQPQTDAPEVKAAAGRPMSPTPGPQGGTAGAPSGAASGAGRTS